MTTEEVTRDKQTIEREQDQARQALTKLEAELAAVEGKRQEALDDPAVEEAALAGRSLGKSSAIAKVETRALELPALIAALKRRWQRLEVERLTLVHADLEEQRVETHAALEGAIEEKRAAEKRFAHAGNAAQAVTWQRDEARLQLKQAKESLAALDSSYAEKLKDESRAEAGTVGPPADTGQIGGHFVHEGW